MFTIDRQLMRYYLIDQWGSYVNDFRSLNSEAQQQFLLQQGYRRFADLLAHFTAWWEMGMQVIETYRLEPEFQQPAVDVNSFNAAAVESVRDLSEEQVVRSFEETRKNFTELIDLLSDDDFRNPRIAKQFEIELINHLAEHAIKKDPAR